jgi:hypothetical protein
MHSAKRSKNVVTERRLLPRRRHRHHQQKLKLNERKQKLQRRLVEEN